MQIAWLYCAIKSIRISKCPEPWKYPSLTCSLKESVAFAEMIFGFSSLLCCPPINLAAFSTRVLALSLPATKPSTLLTIGSSAMQICRFSSSGKSTFITKLLFFEITLPSCPPRTFHSVFCLVYVFYNVVHVFENYVQPCSNSRCHLCWTSCHSQNTCNRGSYFHIIFL